VTVPFGEDKRLLLDWTQFQGARREADRLILEPTQLPSQGPGTTAFVEVIEFGTNGLTAWVDLLRERGLAIEVAASEGG
jgi:hypothetical protein